MSLTEPKVPRCMRYWLGLPPLPPRTQEELEDEFWGTEEDAERIRQAKDGDVVPVSKEFFRGEPE